jgi:hypothetical protein
VQYPPYPARAPTASTGGPISCFLIPLICFFALAAAIFGEWIVVDGGRGRGGIVSMCCIRKLPRPPWVTVNASPFAALKSGSKGVGEINGARSFFFMAASVVGRMVNLRVQWLLFAAWISILVGTVFDLFKGAGAVSTLAMAVVWLFTLATLLLARSFVLGTAIPSPNGFSTPISIFLARVFPFALPTLICAGTVFRLFAVDVLMFVAAICGVDIPSRNGPRHPFLTQIFRFAATTSIFA